MSLYFQKLNSQLFVLQVHFIVEMDHQQYILLAQTMTSLHMVMDTHY